MFIARDLSMIAELDYQERVAGLLTNGKFAERLYDNHGIFVGWNIVDIVQGIVIPVPELIQTDEEVLLVFKTEEDMYRWKKYFNTDMISVDRACHPYTLKIT